MDWWMILLIAIPALVLIGLGVDYPKFNAIFSLLISIASIPFYILALGFAWGDSFSETDIIPIALIALIPVAVWIFYRMIPLPFKAANGAEDEVHIYLILGTLIEERVDHSVGAFFLGLLLAILAMILVIIGFGVISFVAFLFLPILIILIPILMIVLSIVGIVRAFNRYY